MHLTEKKLPALLLALTLGLSLTACGGQSDPTAQPTPEPTPSAQASAPAETPQAVEIDYRDPDVHALVQGGANIGTATVYGIYSMEGDAVDSAIRTAVYYDLDQDQVVRIDFDELQLPCAQGGAEGWATVNEETAAALGQDVLTQGEATCVKSFRLGELVWTGEAQEGHVVYTAQIGGQTREFIEYVATQEGGEWYYATREQGAQALSAAGETLATLPILTKAEMEHGVHFWPSPITFPGNLELIKNHIYDHGVDYGYAPDSGDIHMVDGVWAVADATTGATLAGAPNYFNLVKQACEQIAAGNYTKAE